MPTPWKPPPSSLFTILSKSVTKFDTTQKTGFSIDSPYDFINSIRHSLDFKTVEQKPLFNAWAEEISKTMQRKEQEIGLKHKNHYSHIYKNFIYYLASQSDLQTAFISLTKTDYFKNLLNNSTLVDKHSFFEKTLIEAAKFGAYKNIEALLNTSDLEANKYLKKYLLSKKATAPSLFLEDFYSILMLINFFNEKEQIKYLKNTLSISPQKPFAEKALLGLELNSGNPSLTHKLNKV